MSYLKPQTPLQHKDGDYFYPLTTIDQVIMEDGITRLSGADLISVSTDGAPEGEVAKINAELLDGRPSTDYVLKTDGMVVTKNYSVVGGVDEPTTPTENMIWIQTENTIGKVYFSSVEPSSVNDNDVWIYTGNSSNVAFNAIKIGNDTMNTIYPLVVKQYISGTWVEKEAKSYQGGEWVEWVAYIHSVENGYNMSRFGLYSTPFLGARSFTVDESGIYMVNGNDSLSNFIINNPIDLTPYSYLEFEVKGQAGLSGFGVGFTSSASASTDAEMDPTGWGQFSWSEKSVSYTSWTKFRIDLTAANTKMYFRIGQWNAPGGFYVRNIVFK